MSRRQRRMARRTRGQAVIKMILLFFTASAVLAGLSSHLPGREEFRSQRVVQPTATPITSAFDETITEREVSLQEECWYAIQTGVYSTREAAESRTALYADRGAPGYAVEDDGKWRVFIACYGERSDAASVQERLSTDQKVETHLHAWAAQPAMLRMSGMTGQLDVAESGLYLPGQAAVRLRDAAIALDAGEASMERVQQTAAALDESITLWAKTARERFVAPYPTAISVVLDFADDWTERRKGILQTTDATELSAELKQLAMAAFDSNVRLREQLLEQ